jgi:hypothetical protein
MPNIQMQRTCQKRHAFCEVQKPRHFCHAADLGRTAQAPFPVAGRCPLRP